MNLLEQKKMLDESGNMVPYESFKQNLKILNFGDKNQPFPFKLSNTTSIEEL